MLFSSVSARSRFKSLRTKVSDEQREQYGALVQDTIDQIELAPAAQRYSLCVVRITLGAISRIFQFPVGYCARTGVGLNHGNFGYQQRTLIAKRGRINVANAEIKAPERICERKRSRFRRLKQIEVCSASIPHIPPQEK